jgi:hypothetical protein
MHALAGLTATDFTAIGTISLAVVTVATLITTVVITTRDRRAELKRETRALAQEHEGQAWAVQL